MKTNILFYGNCQIVAIRNTLNLNSNKYNTCLLKCWDGSIKVDFFTNWIQKSDIIIAHATKDNYLNKEYLSTNYILSNCKSGCKIIIVPSCYFNFYFFDIDSLLIKSRKPTDYHYTNMIKCYLKGKSVDYYLTHYVNNPDFKSKKALEKIADDSLQALNNRYNDSQKYKINDQVTTISISKFISDNYKDKLLFHTLNHPTKILIQHICYEIIKITNIETTMDTWSDFLSSTIRNIMYKCVEKVIHFNCPAPLIDLTYKNFYHKHHDAKSITQFYYDAYANLDKAIFDAYANLDITYIV